MPMGCIFEPYQNGEVSIFISWTRLHFVKNSSWKMMPGFKHAQKKLVLLLFIIKLKENFLESIISN